MSAHRRFLFIWGSLVTAIAIVLCWIPLFNLLAFEYCFAIGIPIAIGAGLFGVRLRDGAHLQSVPLAVTLGGCFGILMSALVPISLNALRVQNCDYGEGLVIFMVFPVVSLLVSIWWGLALGRLGRRKGNLLWCLTFLITLCIAGYRFYALPPVDLFNSFLGYYPGALYDDVFLLDERLLWSRLEDISIAGMALAVSAVYSRQEQTSNRPVVIAVMAMLCAGMVHKLTVKNAVYRDAAFVQTALGGHVSSDTIDLYYPKVWSSKAANRILTELEFGYAELKAFFKRSPDKKISIYAYSDADQKKRLMGARRTRIAKPWQWAFHVDAPHIGQAVLIHEMAHVFAADLGNSPHHLSLNEWGLPNMGIIEGVAEAATWESGRLDLHQWTAALHRLKLAPPLESLVRPDGFYSQYARTAYTMCGSLTRYVRDTHGHQAMAKIYREGDFTNPLKQTLDELTTGWKAFLDQQTIPDRALAATRARYDRPTIFARVCAREIASLRREAAQALSARRWSESIELYQQILTHIPDDIGARLKLVRIYILTKKLDEAERIATQVSVDKKAGAVARGHAQEALGDVFALQGKVDSALSQYTHVLPSVFNRYRLRIIAIKTEALNQDAARRPTFEYLLSRWTTKERLSQTHSIVTNSPNWPIGHYLFARAKVANGQLEDGLKGLLKTIAGLTHPSLRVESWRFTARTLFDAGCFNQAAQIYAWLGDQKASLEMEQGERNSMRRWSRRSRFFSQHRTRLGLQCGGEIDIKLPGNQYPAQ